MRRRGRAYVTSVERNADQRGREQGLAQGLEQGVVLGATSLLKRQIVKRFGALPAWALAKLDQASHEELEQWATRVLEAEVVEDVFGMQ